MNRHHLKKYRAKRVERDLSIKKFLREKSGRLRRAARSGAEIASVSTDLLGGDFVSPGGEAFQRAKRKGRGDA